MFSGDTVYCGDCRDSDALIFVRLEDFDAGAANVIACLPFIFRVAERFEDIVPTLRTTCLLLINLGECDSRLHPWGRSHEKYYRKDEGEEKYCHNMDFEAHDHGAELW